MALNYSEAIDYLFNQRPAFERQGASGYKPGLGTSQALDTFYGHPHRYYKTIHVAGTNGKGSVSHLLAATLQSQGYKVGLYTSPHFVDFTERIKVNGACIPHDRVVRFVNQFLAADTGLEPSFFELTTALAFLYFKECDIDIAVIEVGLGGRLDSTNIITPVLSVITNISIDHTEFLGNTLAQIAAEKAGIIKHGIPVVAGKLHPDARQVVTDKALEEKCNIILADDVNEITASTCSHSCLRLDTRHYDTLSCQLTGNYQVMNAATALCAITALRQSGIEVSSQAVEKGFAHVCDITSFRGRWTALATKPLTICDSAHNVDGITHAMAQLKTIPCNRLHMVVGFMADKDLYTLLGLLPVNASYYFTQAASPRALKCEELLRMASSHGLNGKAYSTVELALEAARSNADLENDVIYVGGSMYVLAEVFAMQSSTR